MPATARRLRNGVEPCGGNGAVQQRGERQRVAFVVALDDIAAVQRHRTISPRQRRSSGRAAEVAQDAARPRRIGAPGPKQSPPCPSAAKIGAIEQPPSPRREPARCAGWKSTQGFVEVIVCPDDGGSPSLDLPRRDVVAAQEGTKQLALDVTVASLSLYRDQRPLNLDSIDDERIVASALHAEDRAPEPAVAECGTASGESVEHAARVRRQQKQWTRGVMSQIAEIARAHGPLQLHLTTMYADHRIATVGATRRDERGRIYRGVERGRSLGPVLERAKCETLCHESPHTAAGKRSPQLGRHEQRNATACRRELCASFHEQRREIDLRREPSRRVAGARAELPTSLAIRHEPGTQTGARSRRNVVQPHPRRIADHEIEAAARMCRAEVGRKRERNRSSISETTALAA